MVSSLLCICAVASLFCGYVDLGIVDGWCLDDVTLIAGVWFVVYLLLFGCLIVLLCCVVIIVAL